MAGGLVDRLRIASQGVLRSFPRRPLSYWLAATVILAATTWAMPFIDSHLNLQAEHDWLFQQLTKSAANPTVASQVRLVVIKDDEFWLGDLHHRRPTDRRYLARIIRALRTAGASVIALDFDLRTPIPSPTVEPGAYGAVDTYDAYRAETDELVRAIDEVAQDRKIVLAKTISGPDNGPFKLQSDAYQPYGICTKLADDGRWQNPGTPAFPLLGNAQHNISCGYIALMDDARRIPPSAKIVGQVARLDSFAVALARARDRRTVPDLTERPYFGAYIEGDEVNDPNVTVSAHDLLVDPAKQGDVLSGWPVVVGAGWHQDNFGGGVLVDTHPTPIGAASGALIHQNLADALLSRRAFTGLDTAWQTALEVLTGVAAAVLFAVFSTLWKKLAAIAAAMFILLAVQWLILSLFAFFFDAFVPVFALGLHALFDRLVGEANEEQDGVLERLVGSGRRARFWRVAGGATHDTPPAPPAGQRETD